MHLNIYSTIFIEGFDYTDIKIFEKSILEDHIWKLY